MLASAEGANVRSLCRRFGVSPTTGYKWLERWQLDGAVGLQELSRRPHNSPSRSVAAAEQAVLSATFVYVGPWVDVSRSGAASGLPATGYPLVNLAGSYDLGKGISAYARIDNLFDRRYQVPTGFLRPGFGVFAGVRLALDAARAPW